MYVRCKSYTCIMIEKNRGLKIQFYHQRILKSNSKLIYIPYTFISYFQVVFIKQIKMSKEQNHIHLRKITTTVHMRARNKFIQVIANQFKQGSSQSMILLNLITHIHSLDLLNQLNEEDTFFYMTIILIAERDIQFIR